MKIQKLTSQQEARLSEFKDLGINTGLSVDQGEFDTERDRIIDLCQKHRELCGVRAATHIYFYDSPFEAIKNHKGLTAYNVLYGSHDSYWVSLYDYYDQVLELKEETKQLRFYSELIKLIGWAWMSSDTIIVTRKPINIQLQSKKNTKVLHCFDSKPAVEYKDGTGVYALNGLRVPAEYTSLVQANPEDIKLADILKISNVELRNELFKRVGFDRALKHLPHSIIDTYTSAIGGSYRLYELQLSSSNRTYLQGCCPSSLKTFFEAVPPTITTCLEALAWREGDTSDYTEPKVRT